MQFSKLNNLIWAAIASVTHVVNRKLSISIPPCSGKNKSSKEMKIIRNGIEENATPRRTAKERTNLILRAIYPCTVFHFPLLLCSFAHSPQSNAIHGISLSRHKNLRFQSQSKTSLVFTRTWTTATNERNKKKGKENDDDDVEKWYWRKTRKGRRRRRRREKKQTSHWNAFAKFMLRIHLPNIGIERIRFRYFSLIFFAVESIAWILCPSML